MSNQKLIKASIDGDLNSVKELLAKEEIDINIADI